MAGYRYNRYRGRGSKAKAALAVVLVLIILASLCVIYLQSHIVYDETGQAKLDLSRFQEETKEEEPLPPLDLTIEGPAGPEMLTAFTVAAAPLTGEAWTQAQAAAGAGESVYNAVAVTLKDSGGRIYFDAAGAVPGTVDTAADTAGALAALTGGEGFRTIARLSCFHDPKAANANVEAMGLKNTGGYIFYDGGNSQWLDPGKPGAREYLCGLAKEAAALGFDEVLLADVSYPTEGKLDKIAYGETGKSENLNAFLTEVRAALADTGVTLSLEVSAEVVTAGADNNAGLVLTEIAPLVDRIYAAVPPEQAEDCRAAVAAASGTTGFVAELTPEAAPTEGSSLRLVP